MDYGLIRGKNLIKNREVDKASMLLREKKKRVEA